MLTRSVALGDQVETHKSARYTVLEGRACPWWVTQNVGETLARGSLTTRPGLPLLLWHDHRRWPIGHAREWRNEPDGLYGTWQLNDTPDAQLAARLADNGDLTGLSIAFQPIRNDWTHTPERSHVLRLEARLFEVSLTPTPAYVDAEVMSVRSGARTRQLSRRPQESALSQALSRPCATVAMWRTQAKLLRR